MGIFNKNKSSEIDWEEKYNELKHRHDNLYEENRALIKKVNILETRIKKTGYLEPKERQIKWEEILRIKALKKEGLSYSSISKETGWSKSTICRVINGYYD